MNCEFYYNCLGIVEANLDIQQDSSYSHSNVINSFTTPPPFFSKNSKNSQQVLHNLFSSLSEDRAFTGIVSKFGFVAF